MTGMQAVPRNDLGDLNEGFFSGALSVERLEGALWPWRLPHDRLGLYPAPERR